MKESAIIKHMESAVEKIRKLAHENTDLFLGIGGWIAPVGAAVVAVIVYCVNWAVYCYEIGYYHFGLNVPVLLIEEPKVASLSTSVIGGILLVGVLVIAALLGRWAYRNRRYLLLVFVELMVISGAILCPIISTLLDVDITEALSTIATFLFLSIFIVFLLNALSVSSLIFPSREDALARKKTVLKEIEKKTNGAVSYKKKQAKYEKKRKEVEKQINELGQQNEPKENATTEDVVKKALLMVLLLIFVFLIAGIPACFSTGINEAMQKDELTLVMNAKETDDQFREILSEDYVVNGLAIIFENEDGLLVSPCHILNREVVVYTNIQQFIDSEGLIVYTNTYGNIIPKTAALSFESSNDSNVVEGNS